MKKILVTYATMAGATVEVARAVGEELEQQGVAVEVVPLSDVQRLDDYAGVVVGGPMIMGWHRQALGFLRRHRTALRRVPLAVFVTAMSLTRTGDTNVGNVPVYVDEKLPKPPAVAGRLSFRERYALVTNYVRPIVAAAGPARPVSIGVFGGRLEYGRLKWWAVLFAMLIIRAPAGDRRNWPAIRAWAGRLPAAFGLAQPQAVPIPAGL